MWQGDAQTKKRTQLKHVARDAALLIQEVLDVGGRNVRDVGRISSDRWVLATTSKRLACCRSTIHTPDKSHEVDVGQRRRSSGHEVLKRRAGTVHVSCEFRLLSSRQMQRQTVRQSLQTYKEQDMERKREAVDNSTTKRIQRGMNKRMRQI